MTHLQTALHMLGFNSPILNGRYCGVFRGPDMDMTSKSSPGTSPELQAFDFGAQNTEAIRRILEKIVDISKLELKILRWDPGIP